MINVEDNKNKFISIVKENIHRDGIDRLLNWLENSDFYTAPASSKNHCNEPGGLCVHSLAVYEQLKKKQEDESDESIAIVSLFHDLCKVNLYKQKCKCTKNNDDGSTKSVYYTTSDDLPLGHGEKSLYLIAKYIDLTDEEALSVRWHMGAYSENGINTQLVSQASKKYKLVLKLHTSDAECAFWFNT